MDSRYSPVSSWARNPLSLTLTKRHTFPTGHMSVCFAFLESVTSLYTRKGQQLKATRRSLFSIYLQLPTEHNVDPKMAEVIYQISDHRRSACGIRRGSRIVCRGGGSTTWRPRRRGGLGLINIRLRYIASIEYSERFFFFLAIVKKFVEKKNGGREQGGSRPPPPPDPRLGIDDKRQITALL